MLLQWRSARDTQPGRPSRLHPLDTDGSSLMCRVEPLGGFQPPGYLREKESTAGHEQSGRFLECAQVNFPFQGTEEPTRRRAMLDLVANKEGLVGNMKLQGSLGWNEHKMMWFRILRAVRSPSNEPGGAQVLGT